MVVSQRRATGLVAFAAGLSLLAGCAGGSNGGAEPGASGGDVPEWCGGDKQITLAMLDGFGGNPWRQIAAESARQEAALCPSVTDFVYADAQGDTQKAISDINAMTATGVGAMIVFPDVGEAVLPALRKAYEAGVVTVPYRSNPGGEAGVDYDVYIEADHYGSGIVWGEWIKEHFPDGAKLLPVGGPAGNTQGVSQREALDSVLTDDKYEWLGQQPFEVTDWNPAKTQQVISAAVAKYPDIDVIVGEYGSSFVGGLDAFESAGRSIPAVLSEDGHAIGCYWTEKHEANPEFTLATVTTGVDHARLAVQHAVALATGGTPPESTIYEVELFEDSTSEDHPVQCDPDVPLDAHLSGQLPLDDLKRLFGE